MGLVLCGAVAACGGRDAPSQVTTRDPDIRIVAGADSQAAVVGTALPNVVQVRIIDQDSVPFANQIVGWSVVSGAGTLSLSASTTDANGHAATAWTLGTVAGAQSIKAQLVTGDSVLITAFAQPGPVQAFAVASDPFVTVVAGNVTDPIRVRALDQYSNAVANVPITWQYTGGSLLNVQTLTGSNGVASAILLTATTPQDYTVTASATGGYTAMVTVRGH